MFSMNTTHIDAYHVDVSTAEARLKEIQSTLASDDVQRGKVKQMEEEAENDPGKPVGDERNVLLRKNARQRLIEEAEKLERVIQCPPAPPKMFKLKEATADSPPETDAPLEVPQDEWTNARATFQVVYPRVNVRERPSLRSKVLDMIRKGRVLHVKKETKNWVNLIDGGWVLKHHTAFGTLLSPMRKQKYQENYPYAVRLNVKYGRILKPDEQKPADSTALSAFMSPLRQGTAPPTIRSGLEHRIYIHKGESKKDGAPPPPPAGWEVLFDELSGKNYYYNTLNGAVRWTRPAKQHRPSFLASFSGGISPSMAQRKKMGY